MSTAPGYPPTVCPPTVCPPTVWQSSDGELLAELGALETQLHATWAQMLSVIAEIDFQGHRHRERLWHDSRTGAGHRVPRNEVRSRVDAAADVLPGRGLGGVPVGPRLPQTAAAVADHVIGAARQPHRAHGDPSCGCAA